MPSTTFENLLVGKDQLVGSDADVPVIICSPALSFLLAFLLVSIICQNLESWTPFLELHFPIKENTGGNDDKVRTPYAFVARKMSEEGDGLDGLSASQ